MKDTIEKTVLFALTVLVSAMRIAGVKSVAFQALAHCLVGFLFGAATRRDYSSSWNKLAYYGMAGLLTFVETVCFVYSKLN